jgi:hypothetical protein
VFFKDHDFTHYRQYVKGVFLDGWKEGDIVGFIQEKITIEREKQSIFHGVLPSVSLNAGPSNIIVTLPFSASVEVSCNVVD